MPTTESDNGRIAVGSSSRSVSPALVLAVLAAASFIAALDVWITNVGLPAIKGRRREIPVEPQLGAERLRDRLRGIGERVKASDSTPRGSGTLLRERINALPFVDEGYMTLDCDASTRSESRRR